MVRFAYLNIYVALMTERTGGAAVRYYDLNITPAMFVALKICGLGYCLCHVLRDYLLSENLLWPKMLNSKVLIHR